jgi:GT2 family glycosyltransferase
MLRESEGDESPTFSYRPLVSVVIPTYRRLDFLRRCLTGVCAQKFPRRSFEVIVCDDGPDEETRRLVACIAQHEAKRGLAVRYVPVTATQGPAGARNRGWRSARASVVAFTDDDTIPHPHWLSCGCAAMADPGVAAVAGRIEVPLPPAPTDYERDAARLSNAEFATANCFVRRAMLERVGGFDERFTAAWREDSDLQFAILSAGGKVLMTEDAVVVHPVRRAPWGCSIAQQKKSRFDALLYKKHGELFARRIAQHPPWHYYAIVGCLAVAVVAALAGAMPIAAAAFAVWLAFTARFAMRRLAGTKRTPAHVAEMIVTSMAIPPVAVFWRLYGAIEFRVAFL